MPDVLKKNFWTQISIPMLINKVIFRNIESVLRKMIILADNDLKTMPYGNLRMHQRHAAAR